MTSRVEGPLLPALGRRALARIKLDAYGCELPREIVGVQPAIDAEVRLATPDDFAALGAFLLHARPAIIDFAQVEDLSEDLERRYDRGDRCILAIVKNQIAHCGWVRFGDASMPGLGILAGLDAHEAYLYGGYTLPEFRGQGLQRAGIAERMRYLRTRETSKAYRWVRSTDQHTSLVPDLGWRLIGRVTQLRWRVPEVHLIGVIATAIPPSDPLSTFMSSTRLRLTRSLVVLRRDDQALAMVRRRAAAGER
jgi:ribosomal protein S18 acetylase RimI-like enzyme